MRVSDSLEFVNEKVNTIIDLQHDYSTGYIPYSTFAKQVMSEAAEIVEHCEAGLVVVKEVQ